MKDREFRRASLYKGYHDPYTDDSDDPKGYCIWTKRRSKDFWEALKPHYITKRGAEVAKKRLDQQYPQYHHKVMVEGELPKVD